MSKGKRILESFVHLTYLYIFLIIKFIAFISYNKAASSIEKLKADSKGDKNKIVKSQPLKSSSEKHYWIAFAKFLKKCDKLPAVAFTLSRSKCDRNAEYLMSIDLTTQLEKNYISYYFKSSIGTLKEEDQNLPQVWIFFPLVVNFITDIIILIN